MTKFSSVSHKKLQLSYFATPSRVRNMSEAVQDNTSANKASSSAGFRKAMYAADDYKRLALILDVMAADFTTILAIETRKKTENHRHPVQHIFYQFNGQRKEIANLAELWSVVAGRFNDGFAELQLSPLPSARHRTASALEHRFNEIRTLREWHEEKEPPTGHGASETEEDEGDEPQSAVLGVSMQAAAASAAAADSQERMSAAEPSRNDAVEPPPPLRTMAGPRRTVRIAAEYWYLKEDSFLKKFHWEKKKRDKIIEEIKQMSVLFPVLRKIYGTRPDATQTRSSMNPAHIDDVRAAASANVTVGHGPGLSDVQSPHTLPALTKIMQARVYCTSAAEKKRSQPDDASAEGEDGAKNKPKTSRTKVRKDNEGLLDCVREMNAGSKMFMEKHQEHFNVSVALQKNISDNHHSILRDLVDQFRQANEESNSRPQGSSLDEKFSEVDARISKLDDNMQQMGHNIEDIRSTIAHGFASLMDVIQSNRGSL